MDAWRNRRNRLSRGLLGKDELGLVAALSFLMPVAALVVFEQERGHDDVLDRAEKYP